MFQVLFFTFVMSGILLGFSFIRKGSGTKTFLKVVFGGSFLLLLAIVLPSIRPAKKRNPATLTLENLRMIDAAIDQYAIEFKKQPGSPVDWSDIQLYIKEGTRFHGSKGKDMYGNPYLFKEVGSLPKLSPETYSALSDVAPKDFWSPYY